MAAFPNLRSIFASARTSDEEKRLSRATFYRFAVFVGSCVVISLIASRHNRPKDVKQVVTEVTRQIISDRGLKLV